MNTMPNQTLSAYRAWLFDCFLYDGTPQSWTLYNFRGAGHWFWQKQCPLELCDLVASGKLQVRCLLFHEASLIIHLEKISPSFLNENSKIFWGYYRCLHTSYLPSSEFKWNPQTIHMFPEPYTLDIMLNSFNKQYTF